MSLASVAEQIPDPFFLTNLHGNGMGLPISCLIFESHGGHLFLRPRRDFSFESARSSSRSSIKPV